MQGLILAADIIDMCSISYQTVNYYTSLGLFVVVRMKGNKRLYNREDVEKQLKRVNELKKQGYSLKAIRQELD